MPSALRLLASLALCAGVAVAVFWRAGPPAPAAAGSSGVSVPPLAPPNTDGLALQRDPAAVFQRAFWRRPAADDRILHAERRDWLDASRGVEQWQWFIAVQPGAAFRDWFFKDNPFELVAVAPDTPAAALTSPPDWFPSAAELSRLVRYRNREGRYLVFHDVIHNRLYATDAGGGFTVARK